MSNTNDRVFIIPPALTSPLPGFFAIRLKKDAPERGLRVMFNDGVWSVFLDAKLCGMRSMVWQQAFGDLYRNDILVGRPITAEQYARLCESRLLDCRDGHDLNKPIDLNHVTIRKF